jgi:nicotinamide-nucleotide amidase
MGYGDESVESFVARLLVGRGVTLATAESCTGGAIAARLTAMEGASAWFRGGVVAYDNMVKVDVLGVRAGDIAAAGAVSRTVAEQMAAGVRRVCKADYGIAATGIAGPSGGSAEKPVGTVWIAVASPSGTVSRLYRFGALREQNIQRAATAALNMLRETL